jgi:hypothetical protein
VVVKESIKTIININANEYGSYGYENNPTNYTLVPNSGVYNVVVSSIKNSFDGEPFDPVPVQLFKGNKLIKVKENCKNYISEGKNILFILDGLEYNTISTAMPRNYGGLIYWYFDLERTT